MRSPPGSTASSAPPQGKTSPDVVIASGVDPAYAMPAAGWAAESGDPVLFVGSSGIPAPTRQALLAHQSPHIYVLGPSSVIPDATLSQLRKYGPVKRVSGPDPAANSVAFAEYRDPACTYGQPCAARARKLRLGDAQPGPRVRADQRQPPAGRRGRRAPLGQRRLRSRSCWSTVPLPSPMPCSTSS